MVRRYGAGAETQQEGGVVLRRPQEAEPSSETGKVRTAYCGGNNVKAGRVKGVHSLDAASGFYQIPLHEDSRRLTTFITPFGRYAFHCHPENEEIYDQRLAEALRVIEAAVLKLNKAK